MSRLRHGVRILRDFFHFAAENKKWWMIPLLVTLLLLVALVVTAQTPLAPFVYTLF